MKTWNLRTSLLVVCLLALLSYPPLAVSQSISTSRTHSYESSELSIDSSPSIVSVILTPSEDSFVDNLSPIANFGTLPVMIVQATPSVPVARDIAFLKFKLAGVVPTEVLDSRARPTNASLSLYVRLTNFFYNASVEATSIATNDWTEKTVDWENMPSIVPTYSSNTRVTVNGTWARWNITKVIALALGNSSEVSLALTASSVDWKNYVWFDSKDNSDTGGKTIPRLSLIFVEPYLRLKSQYSHLPITIDTQTLVTDDTGTLEALIPWGIHSVTVPQVLPQGAGKRAVFEGWSDGFKDATRRLTIGNNVTLTLNYGTQYQLNVDSAHSPTNGSGWYFSGTKAKVSVPGSVPVEGLLGLIGVRYIFDHWEGACPSTGPECVVVMDGPRMLTAVWVLDFTVIFIEFLASVSVVLVLATISRNRRKGRRHSRRST